MNIKLIKNSNAPYSFGVPILKLQDLSYTKISMMYAIQCGRRGMFIMFDAFIHFT